MQSIMVVFFIVGLFYMLFYTPAMMTKGLLQLEYGDLSTDEKVKVWIPVYNIALAERTYMNKKFSVIASSTVVFVLALSARPILVLNMVQSQLVHLVSIIVLVVALVVMYVSNVVFVFKVLHHAGTKSIFGEVVSAVFYPMGQYYIGKQLPGEVKWLQKQEETF